MTRAIRSVRMEASNRNCVRRRCLATGLLVMTAVVTEPPVGAEDGILLVNVASPQGRPLANVEIGPSGAGDADVTDAAGKARLRLAPETTPGQWVSLQIINPSLDLVFVSPWDSRAQVPPFENEADNFVPVVLAPRGDRSLLEDPRALVQRINAAASEIARSDASPEVRLQAARERIAEEYGLDATEVDEAIRVWGERTADRYEQGLAAFYEANFSAATAAFADSLTKAEATLEAAQADVIDSAFFLGESLTAEGRYAEAVTAYGRAAEFRRDDARLLDGWATAFWRAGAYREAEPLFNRALVLREAAGGPADPDVAAALNNLAALYQVQERYEEAERLYDRALRIWEAVPGPAHPDVATSLNNLATLYRAWGRYNHAEPLYNRALGILEAALGPDHPNVATVANNYAALLRAMGREEEAAVLRDGGLAALKNWRRQHLRQ